MPSQEQWEELRADVADIKKQLTSPDTGIWMRLRLVEDRAKWAARAGYLGLLAIATMVWDFLKSKLGIL